MADVINVVMRWLHIASVVTLIGGMLYASAILAAAAGTLAPDAAHSLAEKAAARFRPLVWAAMAALVVSGVYNVVTTPGHSARYRLLLVIKLLLVLHVFAAAALATRPNNSRRVRQMKGAFISGLVIVAISAYLRRIF